ncbi:MAG: biotin--[acetyl-CoA-carboxylase] ligase [Thiobacillus sp.]|nr:biotin--[acetyl-CoA-carboxylase] ligase [Thiobacillus sp.]
MPSLLMDVLRCLAHDEFVSGEAIASRLGCSRATVHNAVQEAGREGVAIHAVQGRGYRLVEALDWLRPESLAQGLEPEGFCFHYFERLPSTNGFLLDRARNGGPHRSVALAEWQTEGRGRRGRSWLAALGNGLTFSLLWRSGRPAAELSGLSLAVGVFLVQALRERGLSRAAVKWPNDIVVDGEKLAGVLIELSGDMLGPSAAVVGVGINLRGGEALSRTLGQPVTDLAAHLGPLDRNELFLHLLRRLDAGLAAFEQQGFVAFQEAWNACHAYNDRVVTMHGGQGDVTVGLARGVDDSGALLLETPAGLLRFHSGEVSLRGTGD